MEGQSRQKGIRVGDLSSGRAKGHMVRSARRTRFFCSCHRSSWFVLLVSLDPLLRSLRLRASLLSLVCCLLSVVCCQLFVVCRFYYLLLPSLFFVGSLLFFIVQFGPRSFLKLKQTPFDDLPEMSGMCLLIIRKIGNPRMGVEMKKGSGGGSVLMRKPCAAKAI